MSINKIQYIFNFFVLNLLFDLVKDFEQKMGMTIDAKYIVILEVTTDTKVQDENVNNLYISSIAIDLGEKTTTIKGENNKENAEYVTTKVKEAANGNMLETLIYCLMFVFGICIIVYISTKTEKTNRIKNEFRQELNRILRLCQDKIVKVNNNVDISQTNVIDVKDFGEIIKLSEELFRPILYWASNEKDEACFYVMTNQEIYRYVLTKN